MIRRLLLASRGLMAATRRCVLCGSAWIRPSRHRFGIWAAWLGLETFRCESCGRRFTLPRRLVEPAQLPADGSGDCDGASQSGT
jgi:hypothetical protein